MSYISSLGEATHADRLMISDGLTSYVDMCRLSLRLDVIVLVITPPSHSATVVSSFTGGVSNSRAPLGLWVYIHGDVSRLVVSF